MAKPGAQRRPIGGRRAFARHDREIYEAFGLLYNSPVINCPQPKPQDQPVRSQKSLPSPKI